MDRLETRELAYFLAVSDELHFGRAATRLGIAQPALSKTVRQLERRLGVTLFERTSRAVALTEAGQVLSREARVALEAISAAALRTQRAGTRDPRLILAMKPGGDAGLLPAILAAYEREPGYCRSRWSSGPTPLACCAKDRRTPRCCTRRPTSWAGWTPKHC
jgi:DNA-binding transcriptional LysR family regulator